MTGLLVSVRSAAEAAVALEAGVQVLDVKEPARGSLGRANVGVIEDVLAVAAGRLPVSAALGELTEWRVQKAGGGRQEAVPSALSFAKMALAGCGQLPDWPDAWAEVMAAWPHGVARVAVAYADWEAVCAPQPAEILDRGREFGCRAALLDTHEKRGQALFDHLAPAEVAAWIEQAHELGMLAVVAGSLNARTAIEAAALGPDLVAVRGAVCRGGRERSLDGARIVALQQRIARVLSPFAPRKVFCKELSRSESRQLSSYDV